MLLGLLTVVFLLLYTALLLFYYRQWKQLPLFTPSPAQDLPFASVLIAARNEAHNLPALLADLAAQSLPQNRFEVLVVDDYSTDATAAVVQGAGGNVRLLQPDVPPQASSKKAALAAGVRTARGPLLVITDADCRVGPRWLQTVVSFQQTNEAAFVAAPVRFTEGAGWLHAFQTLDFLTLQGITGAGVSARVHTLCNGANLAYTKQAFEEVDGFAGIDRVATGDDLLLMHKIRQRYPQGVFYLKSPDAVVTTAAAPTWKALLSQRRRWASKTLLYKDAKLLAVLAFVLLFNVLFFALLAAAAAEKKYWLHVAVFLLVKTVVEWPLVSSVSRFFGQHNLMQHFVWLQPLHMVYTVGVGLWSQFGKYEWKGRRTR